MFTDMFGNKRYKLNLHTHTLRSDGWVEPEEAARIYKEAGYDAISLNDHWVVEPGSVMSGLPIYSGCEYNFGIDPTEDGYVYHILSIMHDRDPMVELTDSPQVCINEIIAAGGIPVLAHPAWSLNDPAVFLELEGIEFTEIHNTISGKHNYCRPYSGGFIDLVACRGKLMKLFASDDTHHYDGDHTVASVMVKADSLDPADVKKALKAGDGTIGYARRGKIAPEGTVIATIPVGYADGVDRHLSCGKGYFTVNGQRVPTIGNICMDMCMLDVTGVDVKVGDTVTIFGEDPSISDLAAVLGTIPYEILTSVPRRIERVVIR